MWISIFLEYSSGPSAAPQSADSDTVHTLVSFKSAAFPSHYHLPRHVSKNGVNTLSLRYSGWLKYVLKSGYTKSTNTLILFSVVSINKYFGTSIVIKSTSESLSMGIHV